MIAAFGMTAGHALADDDKDLGGFVARQLKARSEKLFGVEKPLVESAPAGPVPYRTPFQTAGEQVALAHGLKVEYLAREAGNLTDMMAFFPNEHPTHLITCVKSRHKTLANGKLNPSVQRLRFADGRVETILRGMSRCDGLRTTAWGTILATEEQDGGGAYEILDPLAVTGQYVIDRALGTVSDPAHITKRAALPTMAWEGLAVLPSSVVIAGDELRPGTGVADSDGGAIFKFVPLAPRTVAGPIGNLDESPLAAGWVYAMQVSCVSSRQQYGQGCEVNNAAWIPVNAATARADAIDERHLRHFVNRA